MEHRDEQMLPVGPDLSHWLRNYARDAEDLAEAYRARPSPHADPAHLVAPQPLTWRIWLRHSR